MGTGGTVVGVGACVVVGEGASVEQVEFVMTFESKVTAPLRASNRPLMVADVVAATDVSARTVPTNAELVPSVAELPTCQ